MPHTDGTKVIGYLAYATLEEVVCDGDACVIAGSEEAMMTFLANTKRYPGIRPSIRKARFSDIMNGMGYGAAYAFDEQAYNRFYPLASREGLALGPEEFGPTATGVHLVIVRTQGT